MADLLVTVDDRTLEATWTDDAPETRERIADALPLAGEAARWGDELYFRTPVEAPAENAWTAVEPGTVAFWPTGNALCLFWGSTPASEGDEPRAASPVNVVARVADVSPLSDLEGGARVRIEAADGA